MKAGKALLTLYKALMENRSLTPAVAREAGKVIKELDSVLAQLANSGLDPDVSAALLHLCVAVRQSEEVD